MKALADENFPGTLLKALRNLGWNIEAASEEYSGAKDREIYEIARLQGRILLTFDKDFGELHRQRRSRRRAD